ncbi:MAG: 6-phosphogluconolactonase [Gammaproteobacteria bacterium]
MKSHQADLRWEAFDDPEQVAVEAAHRIQGAAEAAIAANDHFKLVLAGGTTPERAYQYLRGTATDWSRWAIFFGDERCLPRSHPDRNATRAQQAWLDHVRIAPANIHTIPAELGPETAARAYASIIEDQLPFDMVLLGLGEDGHTASLFPGAKHPQGELVHAVRQAPKLPAERVTLSAACLSETLALLVLVTGETKRTAVQRWRAGEALPITRLCPPCGLTVLMDAAALDSHVARSDPGP